MPSLMQHKPVGTILTNKYALQTDNGEWDEMLWERLVRRVMKDYGVRRLLAEQIMDQALGFLYVIALHPGTSFSPAPMPDVGWHTFLLYTREYAKFCERVAGRFIHHAPFDAPGMDDGSSVCPAHTAEAMRAAGLNVIDELWRPSRRKLKQRLPL